MQRDLALANTRVVEEAIRICEANPMPAFDSYNEGNPHPVLDYVILPGSENAEVYSE